MSGGLLYSREWPVNDSIRVVIPTVGEVLEDEDGYYRGVQMLTAQPIDFMVPLDDAGIDFTKINEWELFLTLSPALAQTDTHLLLDGIRFDRCEMMVNEQNGQILLLDTETGARFDRALLGDVADALRKIHHLEKNRRKPANEEARQFMLERARAKARRRKKRANDSELEPLITALVNTEQFKYDYEGALGLTIYQFNESVRQIIRRIDYEHRMHGVYAGTVNPKELSQNELTWLPVKQS